MASLALLLTPGCAGLSSGTGSLAQWHARQQSILEADFDDVDAVVAGVLPKFHMIDISRSSDNPDIRRFNLRMLNDAPGTLEFEKLADGQVEIRVALGRFPEPRREKKLVRALAKRFEQLRGKVAAPITLPEQN